MTYYTPKAPNPTPPADNDGWLELATTALLVVAAILWLVFSPTVGALWCIGWLA